MRNPAAAASTTLLAFALACGSAWAAAPLYTNKDLERFPSPPSSASPPVAAPADDSLEDWRLVFEMLDRERARQESERNLQWRREQDASLAKQEREDRRETVLWSTGWAGLGAFGFHPAPIRPFCRPGTVRRPHSPVSPRAGGTTQPR